MWARWMGDVTLKKSRFPRSIDKLLRRRKDEAPKGSDPLFDFGPLYHDYGFFGRENAQLEGIYAGNQRSKEPIINSYISYAIGFLKALNKEDVTFCEMFCADGYYAMVADRMGCDRATGLDSDRDGHFGTAREIAKALGLEKVDFEKVNIQPDADIGTYSIVANVGGLYHVDDPEGILDLSYRMAKDFLIVQTVVSLATDSADYFEKPAPGWDWGNRYSAQSFDRLVRSKFGSSIIMCEANQLKGNSRPQDRGSMYYLIQK